jgi:hypothetical protein
MIHNNDGTVTFPDAEWAQWSADEAYRYARIAELEAQYLTNLDEINRLSGNVASLTINNEYLRVNIESLTNINTQLLIEITDLRAQLEPNTNAPTANAGTDVTTVYKNIVLLDGSSSSDPNSLPLTYSWNVILRPLGSVSLISNAETVNPTFFPDVIGNYVINLLVNNGNFSSTSDNVQIIATIPVANIASVPPVIVDDEITLDGSASQGPELTTLFYSWTLTTKPSTSTAALSDGSIVNPTLTPDVEGTYQLSLVVSDGILSSLAKTISFISYSVNIAPIANAGSGPLTSPVGTLITLNGSGSSDPNGDAITYAWTMTSRPGGSTAILIGSTTIRPTFTPDVAGTYVVTLVVSDGSLTDSSALTITATAVNHAPIAVIGSISNALTTVPVSLVGTGSSDPDSDFITYAWTLTTRPTGSTATISSPTSATASITPDVAGAYGVRLIVNDGSLSSTPATLSFNAAAANIAPIADGGPGGVIIIGTLTVLDGSGSYDPNGDPITYLWEMTSKPTGSTATLSSTTIVNPSFMPDLVGTYLFNLRVNDGIVNSEVSSIGYNALAVPNRAPIALVTGNLSVTVGTATTVSGSTSYDPDGDTITYAWTLTKPVGSASTLTGATSVTASFTPDVAGTYTVSLVVNDGLLNSVATSSSSRTITASVASAGWIITASFETGTLGAAANGANGFAEAGTYTVIDNTHVYSGTKSARCGIDAGDDGSGPVTWGGLWGYYNSPLGPVVQNGEIWFRVRSFFPVGFNYQANPRLKFLRINTVSTHYGNDGYLDLYILNNGRFSHDNELTGVSTNAVPFGNQLALGTWETYEVYAKLHATQGKYRVWQNGILIYENLTQRTLASATSWSEVARIFTFWNGGSPATQNCWIDDVVLRTSTPSNQDAAGNWMIGV